MNVAHFSLVVAYLQNVAREPRHTPIDNHPDEVSWREYLNYWHQNGNIRVFISDYNSTRSSIYDPIEEKMPAIAMRCYGFGLGVRAVRYYSSMAIFKEPDLLAEDARKMGSDIVKPLARISRKRDRHGVNPFPEQQPSGMGLCGQMRGLLRGFEWLKLKEMEISQ